MRGDRTRRAPSGGAATLGQWSRLVRRDPAAQLLIDVLDGGAPAVHQVGAEAGAWRVSSASLRRAQYSVASDAVVTIMAAVLTWARRRSTAAGGGAVPALRVSLCRIRWCVPGLVCRPQRRSCAHPALGTFVQCRALPAASGQPCHATRGPPVCRPCCALQCVLPAKAAGGTGCHDAGARMPAGRRHRRAGPPGQRTRND